MDWLQWSIHAQLTDCSETERLNVMLVRNRDAKCSLWDI